MELQQVLNITDGSVEHGALVSALRDTGFHYPDDIILAFLAGSSQHGARLEGKSDVDIAGIYIEPPHKLIGLDIEEHFTHNTSDNSRRNTAEDEDYKLYSLRHWARLAAKGNPSILSFMFTPETIVDKQAAWFGGVWERYVLPNREAFLARSHAAAFIGYGQSQLHRMQGVRGNGKHGQRPELIDQFGYDSKAAMHLIRLMYEAVELLSTGHITYPRPEKDLLLSIRQGERSQRWIEQEYLRLESLVREAEERSSLPKKVDRARLSAIITEAYLSHWKQRGLI